MTALYLNHCPRVKMFHS